MESSITKWSGALFLFYYYYTRSKGYTDIHTHLKAENNKTTSRKNYNLLGERMKTKKK